ncbi:MAG TPA: 8-amino-7-oxononanoate synthase [Kofleriaceae bacterium]
MSLDEDARAELDRLQAAHRLRVPRVVDGPQGSRILVDGVHVIDLASNDYLGLANDPRLAAAARTSLDEDGVGAGASRLISGNHRRHVMLEQGLADWLELPPGSVRAFGSGYAANVGVLSALVGFDDVVLSDERNHASIIDGCRLSRANVRVFPHRDLAALDKLLDETAGKKRIVVSESLFSMDGDLADIVGLAALCKRHGAALMLDEAHAIGTRGPEGRGEAAACNVAPDVLVGTCGKALGSYGAFVASTPAITRLLWNRARSLVFSTALPPMVSAATLAAVQIVRGSDGDARRKALADNARALRERVPKLGGIVDGAIAPLVIGDDLAVMALSAKLLERGVFVQGIRYPTVAEGAARLRVSLASSLDADDLELVGTAFDDALSQSS